VCACARARVCVRVQGVDHSCRFPIETPRTAVDARSIGSCSVLQRVAVCCSVLQCVVVCCSMLQRVAACCHTLQHTPFCTRCEDQARDESRSYRAEEQVINDSIYYAQHTATYPVLQQMRRPRER